MAAALFAAFATQAKAEQAPAKASTADINVTAYGAKADGKTINTKALQTALDDASARGTALNKKLKKGAAPVQVKVIVPEGVFLTAPLKLRSNVELCLERKAVLRAVCDVDQWRDPANPENLQAFITAIDQNNFSITGDGKIDGDGRNLCHKLDSLHYIGQWKPWNENTHQPNGRPHLVNTIRCNGVKYTGTTFSRSASWTVSFVKVNDLLVEHCIIDSDWFWNNDGIDITDCRNVVVRYCDVNANDDGICPKSEDPNVGCENLLIEKCRVRSSASAIKFGTSSAGGFRNCTVRDIYVYDTYRSAIALESVDGGKFEDILVENITVKNSGNAIFLRLGHRNQDNTPDAWGTLRNITIRDVKAQIAFGRADGDYEVFGPTVNGFNNTWPASITGLPGHPIQNVTLENVDILYPGKGNSGQRYIPYTRPDQIPELPKVYPEYDMFRELPAWGFYVRHCEGLTFNNVRLTAKERDYRPAYVFDDVNGLTIQNGRIYEPDDDIQVSLHKVSGLSTDVDSKLIYRVK